MVHLCRSQAAATGVPVVPPKPFGAARSGTASAKLFQPATPAAAETAAQAASAGQSSSGTDAATMSTSSGAAEADPAVAAAMYTAHAAAPKARLSNPYTEVPGRGIKAGTTQRGLTAQPQHAFSSALQQQRADMPTEPAAQQSTGAMQQLAAAQLCAEDTQDLVTTYSSFNHDPVYPYAAFGADPATSYAEPSNLMDPVDSPAAIRTHAENHAEHYEDAAQVSGNFDDMTELQL